jgi:hypothetical protein
VERAVEARSARRKIASGAGLLVALLLAFTLLRLPPVTSTGRVAGVVLHASEGEHPTPDAQAVAPAPDSAAASADADVARTGATAVRKPALIRRGSPTTTEPVVATATGPRVPAEVLGVNVDWLVTTPVANRDVELAKIANEGIKVVRGEINWDQVEPAPPAGASASHVWHWDLYDAFAASAAKAGVRWSPLIGYSARWDSSDTFQSQFAAPRDSAAFATFARAVVDRYGTGGTFWRERPALHALPATSFEIWNEENTSGFWAKPDPARYAEILADATAAIHAAAPTSRVVMGGLARAPWTGGGSVKDTDFVAGVFATRPALKAQLGGIAYHPYAATPDGVFDAVSNLRQALRSLGVPAMPILVNEIGWPTRGAGPFRPLPEDARAWALSHTVDGLARSDCGIAQVLVYDWISSEQDPNNQVDWFGLYRRDGSATPTAAAFSAVVAALQSDQPAPAVEPVVHLCG